MPSYHHETAPSVPSAKGKERASGLDRPLSHSAPFPRKAARHRRRPLSHTTFTKPSTGQDDELCPLEEGEASQVTTAHAEPRHKSSTTWTTSSLGDPGLLNGGDEIDTRERFVHEYNRLATKYGFRHVVADFNAGIVPPPSSNSISQRRGSWFAKILRQTAPVTSSRSHKDADQQIGNRSRSVSGLAAAMVHSLHKDPAKNEDISSMIRLCGKSLLYLPSEYAPGPLLLPTCLRATAQAIVQQVDVRGIFRVNGSVRVVAALHAYYFANEKETGEFAGTIRVPNLPTHISYGIHDVASAFKRFLGDLAGGILGSLTVFDALVAIHTQLPPDPELLKTKESKLRARLIALAIGTVSSQHRRELICGVLGLLCLVGRSAENAPREDEDGRPLPTNDLMGYQALGIVFGPLLIGDLINGFTMKMIDPLDGLLLQQIPPPKSKKERREEKHRRKHQTGQREKDDTKPALIVDKLHIANNITEMLLIHWRDIVKHMRDLDAVYNDPRTDSPSKPGTKISRHPPISEIFAPGRADKGKLDLPGTPTRRRAASSDSDSLQQRIRQDDESLIASINSRPRSFSTHSASSTHQVSRMASLHLLSPTVEESPGSTDHDHIAKKHSETGLARHVDRAANHAQQGTPTKTLGRVELEAPPISAAIDDPYKQKDGFQRLETMPGPTKLSLSDTEGKQSQSDLNNYMTSNVLAQELDFDLASSRMGQAASDETSGNGHEVSSSSSQKWKNQLYKDSSAGRTPLRHDLVSRSQKADSTQHQTSSGSRSHPSENEHEKSVMSPPQQLASKRSVPTNRKSPFGAILSELGSLSPRSLLAKFPRIQSPASALDERGSKVTPRRSVQGEISVIEKPDDMTPSALHEQGQIAKAQTESSLTDASRRSADPSKKRNARYRLSDTGGTGFRGAHGSPVEASREKRTLRKALRSRRQSQESQGAPNKDPNVPAWKRHMLSDSSTTEPRHDRLVPDRTNQFESSSHGLVGASPLRGGSGSEMKGMTQAPNSETKRSASRPMSGAVKAMAARFDRAIMESPDRVGTILSGRSQSNVKETPSLSSRATPTSSPEKSSNSVFSMFKPRTSTPPPAMNAIQHADQAPAAPKEAAVYMDRTPVPFSKQPPGTTEATPRFANLSLRPTGFIFSAARNEPRHAPAQQVPARDRELSRAPHLGTMVPQAQEPPVAQHLAFARPSSGRSSMSRDFSLEPSHERGLVRSGSGNSILHSQIRSLRQQLENKNEEVNHLRRQIETRDSLDFGTLSEQLREANRQCSMWRKRAESAERRLAVVDRFTARVKGLRDAGSEETGKDCRSGPNAPAALDQTALDHGWRRPKQSSSATDHTEERDIFRERLRGNMESKRHGMFMGDGTGLETDGRVFEDSVFGRGSPVGSSSVGVTGQSAELWNEVDKFLRESSSWGL